MGHDIFRQTAAIMGRGLKVFVNLYNHEAMFLPIVALNLMLFAFMALSKIPKCSGGGHMEMTTTLA